VLLVEADARAAAVIKANAAVVGLPGATVATDRVERCCYPGARPPAYPPGRA
jgi:16S rRNA (guanine966-N2)-methyltransferase